MRLSVNIATAVNYTHKWSSHLEAVMKHNQIGTETYRSFQQHAQLHSTRTIKIHRNSTIMHSPAQITHLATKAHTYSNNSSTNFQWQLFKAGESTTTQQPNPKSNPPTQSETNKTTTPAALRHSAAHPRTQPERSSSERWLDEEGCTHGRGRGEASHAPEHGGGGGGMSSGGSRVWGAGERETAGGPARIRAAAAELGGRGGRRGSGEQASGSNWDREVGGGREGGRTHAHTREDEKRARFSIRASVSVLRRAVWVKFWFGLDWSGSGALLLSPRQKGRHYARVFFFCFGLFQNVPVLYLFIHKGSSPWRGSCTRCYFAN
jgi:hypothetical protein